LPGALKRGGESCIILQEKGPKAHHERRPEKGRDPQLREKKRAGQKGGKRTRTEGQGTIWIKEDKPRQARSIKIA